MKDVTTNLVDPTDPQNAASKSYADTQDSLRVLKTGGMMCDGLDMGANRVTDVANPTDPQDVATKAYANAIAQQYMLRSGDTMTGVLTVTMTSVPGRIATHAITELATTQIENRGISITKGNL